MGNEPATIDWLEVSASLPRDAAEAAEDALLGAGAVSVTLRDAADDPVLEPAPGATPLWPQIVVTGLFAGTADPLAILGSIHGRPAGADWRVAALAERSWEREWLRDFRPMRFGRRLAVVPSGMTPPQDTIVLRLDPGLAFGTGTHPTTALCLEWLDGLALAPPQARPLLAGRLVVDYGSGSGILAIAAVLLGAAEAIAVDIDPQALLATRANAAANAVADRVTACEPAALQSTLRGRKAHVLVANILAGPLAGLLPAFAAMLAEGGWMALSGILGGQEAPLAAAARKWFSLDDPVRLDDWVRLSGHRKTLR
jgi:ribosomal protein L11 methyltransferase